MARQPIVFDPSVSSPASWRAAAASALVTLAWLPASAPAALTNLWFEPLDGPASTRFRDMPTSLALDETRGRVVTAVSVAGGDVAGWTVTSQTTTGTVLWTNHLSQITTFSEVAPATVLVGSTGQIFVAGTVDRTNQLDAAVVVMDGATGRSLWTNIIDGGFGVADRTIAAALDASDRIYLGITATSASGLETDALVVALNPQGQELWRDRLNVGPASRETVAAMAVAPGTGRIYALGTLQQGSLNDWFLRALAPMGMPVFTRFYGQPGFGLETAIDLAISPNGNVVMAGDQMFLDSDLVALAVDALGNPLWTGRVDTGSSDYTADLDIGSDDSVALIGVGDADLVAARWNAAGNPLWTLQFHGPGGYGDAGASVAAEPGGGAVLTGYSSPAPSVQAMTVLGVNPAGTAVWTQFVTGAFYSDGRQIVRDAAGQSYAAGLAAAPATDVDTVWASYSASGVLLWTNVLATARDGRDALTDLSPIQGGALVVRTTRDTQTQEANLALQRADTNGLIGPLREYDAEEGDDLARAAATRPDGSAILAGLSYLPAESVSARLTAVDSTGAESWSRDFVGGGADWSDVVLIPGTDLVAAAGSRRVGFDILGLVHLVTTNGIAVLTNSIDFGSTDHLVQHLAAPPGRLVMAGDYMDGVSGTRRGFVAEHDLSGGLLWSNMFGTGQGPTVVHDLLTTSNGWAYLAGHLTITANQPDAFVAAYDPAGTQQWFVFSGFSAQPNDLLALTEAADGSILAAGWIRNSGTGRDGMVRAFDPTTGAARGTILFDAGTGADEGFSDIASNPSGHVVAAGSSRRGGTVSALAVELNLAAQQILQSHELPPPAGARSIEASRIATADADSFYLAGSIGRSSNELDAFLALFGRARGTTTAGGGGTTGGSTGGGGASSTVRFESGTAFVTESSRRVHLRVVRDGGLDVAASATFATRDGTARAGVDYQPLVTNLTWAANDVSERRVALTLFDNALLDGSRTFTAHLTNAGPATSLGMPDTASVLIIDNDLAPHFQVLPSPAPATASLTVTLDPPAAVSAGAAWRLIGEKFWRPSGSTALGVVVGTATVEYRPIPGFSAEGTNSTPIALGSNFLARSFEPLTNQGLGTLTVQIAPESAVAAGARWRLSGETNTWSSGHQLSGLPAGVWTIDFDELPGFVRPIPRNVRVVPDQTAELLAVFHATGPANALEPVLVDTGRVQQSPFAFMGQITSDSGDASGTVVRERVVLTTASAVFDDAYLGYATGVRWAFQHRAGEFEPESQTPLGWTIFGGYAEARRRDHALHDESGAYVGSASRNAQLAALYFAEPAGRGGYAGWVTSDAATHPTLADPGVPKTYLGYPTARASIARPGALHTLTVTNAFTLFGPLLDTEGNTNRVWLAPSFASFGAGRGGAITVPGPGGTNFPVAVYLATLPSGSLVRALDADAADLIDRADLLGLAGTRQSRSSLAVWPRRLAPRLSGGVVGVSPGTGSGMGGFFTGSIRGTLSPETAVLAGARWRLGSRWFASGEWVKGLAVGDFDINFRAASGFQAPGPRRLRVEPNQTTVFSAAYTASSDGSGPPPANGLELSSDPTNRRWLASALGDLNRDGIPDVVRQRGRMFDALAMGTNAPFALTNLAITGPVVGRGKAFAAVDLDRDGHVDILRARGRNAECLFLQGQAIQRTEPIGQGRLPGKPVAAADFDGDKQPDLLLRKGKRISLAILSSSTNFTALPVTGLPSKVRVFAAGDTLGSDRPDLVARRKNVIQIFVLENGSVAADALFNDDPANRRFRIVAAGDLDADGLDDLLRRRSRILNALSEDPAP